MARAADAKQPRVEMINPLVLKPHQRNYKKHPQDQLDHLKRSIEEHGFYRNVVVARDNTILAGHGVVLAAGQLREEGKLTEVPVVRLDLDPTDPRALKLVIADNEIGHLAQRDDRLLTELLKEIGETDDLLGTGFDAAALAGLAHVTRNRDEIADFDAAAEWAGMPEYEQQGTPIRLIITFRSEAERAAFCKEKGVRPIKKEDVTRKVWSARWPDVPRNDLSNLKWLGDGTASDEGADDQADGAK